MAKKTYPSGMEDLVSHSSVSMHVISLTHISLGPEGIISFIRLSYL